MPDDPRGARLPFLLFAGFRQLVDDMHDRLAERGHPQVRPSYGFAMQAVGVEGVSAVVLGRRLGVSKQAAGKTADRLEALGYVERRPDPDDARSKKIVLTERGMDALIISAQIFTEIRTEWAAVMGNEQLCALEDGLSAVAEKSTPRLDAQAWFGP
ncbi:MarR family winged helix-turn-helix transcriptional regulator [Rhodococcus sp. NPDC058521]|uniref:MarR family winged helix-turn-helix transcriptional regulator n=1 Tax=Rhodococcus sp. NPDC058521 TaxID=3346536 RepID=UPI00364665AE